MNYALYALLVANLAAMAWNARCATVNERLARKNIEVADANYALIVSLRTTSAPTTQGEP